MRNDLKNVFSGEGLRESIYPHCPECHQVCHGCSICGFIFTCSRCEPCHENMMVEERLK